MIIVLKQDAPDVQVREFCHELEDMGLQINDSKGSDTHILGLIGDTKAIAESWVLANPVVETCRRVSEPYKKANRKFHPDDSVIDVEGVKIGGGNFAVIAGPCSIESEEQITYCAQRVKAAGASLLRGGAFKPRTSPYDFSGLGAEGGGHIVQIPYLIPLVCSEGHRFSEKSLHLHIGRGHQCAGYSFEINGFLPLIDVESENLRSIYSFCPASA